MPLILDPRSKLARNFKEGLDLTDLMPGGMGMAAKMSSPAVDVLSRWIRRFRKDKPPTVPVDVLEKAIDNEAKRWVPPKLVLRPERAKEFADNPALRKIKEATEYIEQKRPRKWDPNDYMYLGGRPPNLGAREKADIRVLERFLSDLRMQDMGWNWQGLNKWGTIKPKRPKRTKK